MTCNLSKAHRTVRILLAIALIAGGYIAGGTTGIVMYAIAMVPLVTGLSGYCPLCRILSKN